jgi:hypothetical protein
MYLYINTEQVIVDIVEDFKPIKRNKNNIFIVCDMEKAQAFIGSNDIIYPKIGVNIVPSFYDVISVVNVDNIPEDVQVLKWKYVDGEFVRNSEPYPLNNLPLTIGVSENDSAICDVAELSDVNSSAIDDLAEMVDELSNRVSILEEAQND